MSHERWSFWKRGEEESAGGESFERSENDSPPAAAPSEAGVQEPCPEPDDAVQDDEPPVGDPDPEDIEAETADENPSPEASDVAVDLPDTIHDELDTAPDE